MSRSERRSPRSVQVRVSSGPRINRPGVLRNPRLSAATTDTKRRPTTCWFSPRRALQHPGGPPRHLYQNKNTIRLDRQLRIVRSIVNFPLDDYLSGRSERRLRYAAVRFARTPRFAPSIRPLRRVYTANEHPFKCPVSPSTPAYGPGSAVYTQRNSRSNGCGLGVGFVRRRFELKWTVPAAQKQSYSPVLARLPLIFELGWIPTGGDDSESRPVSIHETHR